jgi:phytanoyl-CoA hydroxylase
MRAAESNNLPAFSAPDDGVLDDAMRAAFDTAGVVVLRGFAEPDACEKLRAHTLSLVDAFEPGEAATVFSTLTNAQQSDEYFIESGGAVRFFFEDGAFDEAGRLKQAKENSINKIGHAMHDLDPVFDAFSRTPKLQKLVASLGFADPKLVQSMYIFKPPGIGGEVVCHQDSTFIYTEPESCIGLWFAIDDATTVNGCMNFLPGAHKGPLRERNRRKAGGGAEMITLDDAPFPDIAPVPAPAKRGDLVVFHGRAPHMSGPNRSQFSRHAYTLHIVEGSARWLEDNWLQRPSDLPFRGFSRM